MWSAPKREPVFKLKNHNLPWTLGQPTGLAIGGLPLLLGGHAACSGVRSRGRYLGAQSRHLGVWLKTAGEGSSSEPLERVIDLAESFLTTPLPPYHFLGGDGP